MNTAAVVAEINQQRYDAVLRISEALSACSQPDELAKILADQLERVLSFEHLDLLVLKENSKEMEWRAWGKAAPPDVHPGVEAIARAYARAAGGSNRDHTRQPVAH